MTTEITWTISALDCKPIDGIKRNVVTTVHWRCDATDGEHSASVYSTCGLPSPVGEQFTAYDDLTPAVVLNWIWDNGVDKDATEAAVQAQIDVAKNPPVVTPALPWAV
jgi:hypothetical protein